MGKVVDFKPRKPSEDELYSEEYIDRQYELYYQAEEEERRLQYFKEEEEYLRRKLEEYEQKETWVDKVFKKLFA